MLVLRNREVFEDQDVKNALFFKNKAKVPEIISIINNKTPTNQQPTTIWLAVQRAVHGSNLR